jgi:hypothetical protein
VDWLTLTWTWRFRSKWHRGPKGLRGIGTSVKKDEHIVCSFDLSFSEGNVVNEKIAVETKQPYEEPVLSEYGDIRMITRTIPHTAGNADDTIGTNKTH